MSVEDVPAVTDIERVSFMGSSWTIDAFYHEILENNFAHYFIMEYENKVIGYCGIWIVVDQAQITTIAIEPNYRGLGLGQLMLKYVMNFASAVATLMSLEVRVENRTAQHVYEKLGFEYGGRRKNYYGDGEDALVMWVNLNE
ncbi:ribosomal protein S18-alanine N-acetyltransferase [Staphylococcus felis]|uniref:[Ribosomal protein bS18]-alanine N-acetyltransferase n=1 Tax=Staphylococcus felis TaxID=46127 RepID=A0ABS0QN42_9STAP|nr:ribosomal protein S18-alanine N-acetyltransferase [Staphylococcus felis]MBH9580556.1 ribosomal protein S18-alanine N-acetyltransferase [Staphylococcus felis]MDM8328017.1 ribosomal protein S18-alanine N-acetyltransferase [Staphylococcus felis]REH86633.1 ribosomal-protein-alanine N-acetyltransferase [Staphylococcus felis]REH91595.1 ribosomal-protein-alanine N-acetyltransferase [Staphylococcus felis]REI07554.1 ribosomal-protein-alanine N-acetyltransferase [Staphylococcus felis]